MRVGESGCGYELDGNGVRVDSEVSGKEAEVDCDGRGK